MSVKDQVAAVNPQYAENISNACTVIAATTICALPK
jgi:hypothetical protein